MLNLFSSLLKLHLQTRIRPSVKPYCLRNSPPATSLAGCSRHDIMAETKGMKSPSNYFDVLDFKDEIELTGMAVRKITPDFGCSHAFKTESYPEKMPELSHVLHNDFNSHGQATEIKSDVESGIVFSNVEYGSSPVVTLQLENHSKNAFPVSACNDKSICLASGAINSMTEGSPSDISNNNASSDGPSSDNCFGGGDLDDERVGIVFHADYIVCQGTQYMDSVVRFSRSYVEARSKSIHGDEETFRIYLEIEDIVKIESQWSNQFEAGTINIYFISKDAARVEFGSIHNASGLQELKFPAVEFNWYQKRDAIGSLNLRYKALWNVLLDTGTEKYASSPEREGRILTKSYFSNFDRPFEEVIYPKGDPDAVSISKRDVDLLLPDTFVNDTIIDFYIKYLKTRLNEDESTKFHFFNSFFFRKLADMDKDPSSAFDGEAAFQRVRKWTRKVNLLEKDFILIPVNYNLHWSLIVICYFGEVGSYEDGNGVSGRVPCILHMDSLRGTHSGLKDLMQSYLWEEWKERQKGTCDDLNSKFRNLKFVPLELPQQQNSYDCGLFLLHYVELFLEEVPSNFNIRRIASSSKFLQEDWFPPSEPSIKRTHIEILINGLLDTPEECPPSDGNGMHCSPEGLNITHGFEDDIQLTVKSGPLGGCHENSLCQVEQGIEMTLLPTSSARSIQCTKTSGLVIKELFQQVSAPESYTDAPWGAGECFVSTELAQHVFQNPDGVTPDRPTFPYSSEDYRPEAVYRPTSDDVDSTPVTSGALLNAEGSQGFQGHCLMLSDLNRDSSFSKELPELGQEANQLQNHALSDEDEAVCATFVSGDKLNVEECEIPHQMVSSNDQVDPPVIPVDCSPGSPQHCDGGVGRKWVSESDGEHTVKRMRITPSDSGEELNDNLTQDLNL